jgi:exosome complex RNA-binding protein Rrp42 (RNase PH superfamily)
MVLNTDGNLHDSAFLASLLALMNTKLPEVVLAAKTNSLKVNYERTRYLNVHHLPICTTFSFFKEDSLSQVNLVDSTAKEEKLSASRVVIWVNLFEDVCGMASFGKLSLSPELLLQCNAIALEKARELTLMVRDKWKNRDTTLSLLSHVGA